MCRYDRPSSIYLCICWAGGLVRGHLVVRERVNAISKSALVNEEMGFGHKGPRKVV